MQIEMNYLRKLAQNLAAILLLVSCDSSVPPSESKTFGNGHAILKSVMNPALEDYRMRVDEMNWSGGGDPSSFSVNDSLFIKDATQIDLAEKIVAELKKLSAEKNWISYKLRVESENLIGFEYEESGSRFYLDFVLQEIGADVKILFLHKGIRL
ncbi:MAG: hypothetical protein AB8D78_11700 [Akkermansiaceae bacterium]